MISRLLLVAAILVSVLGSGCSKSPPSQPSTPQTVDLGPVELTYGVGSHHDLGGGKDCVITAQPLDRDSIELNSVLEKAGKKIASTRMAPARIGIPLDLSFGDVRVQLIPVIKPQT